MDPAALDPWGVGSEEGDVNSGLGPGSRMENTRAERNVARNWGRVANMLWMPRYMPAFLSWEKDGRARLMGWEAGEGGGLGVGDEGSSSFCSSSSSGERGKRDISTEASRSLRGKGAVGVSLLISSPMMARGAQPYMAQDAPQRAMRVVANWNEFEKGAMIIEAANKNCDTAHAVVMPIW